MTDCAANAIQLALYKVHDGKHHVDDHDVLPT